MEDSRETNVFMATLAEKVEKYDDMLLYVNNFMKYGYELSPDERYLFSNACKKVIGSLRAIWRNICYQE